MKILLLPASILSAALVAEELTTTYSTEQTLRVTHETELTLETTDFSMERDGEPVDTSRFGAGGAILQVSGSATRASGELLGEFTDQRRSGVGSLESTFLLEKCAHRIGRDVATMITTGTYTQNGGDPDDE